MKKTKKMTKQEIFDVVSAHLLVQGGRSGKGKHPCSYRGMNGRKCAAGTLIPDELYRPEFEGMLWGKVCAASPELDAIGHEKLVQDLQSIHDTVEPISWAKHLRKLARARRLSTEVMDRLAFFTRRTEGC